MKQVSGRSKRSSRKQSRRPSEKAAAGPAAATDSPIRLPGKLEHWPIDRLRPYERNPRTHSPEQITKIAASLLEFGWTNPILVDDSNGVIAGHGRLLAARKLGMTDVPTIELSSLTDAQRRAYILWDNKSALKASWDDEMLLVELRELREGGMLVLTGFDDAEFEMLARGWAPDSDIIDKHGESLDGVATTIRVTVDADQTEQAKEIISKALEAGGVTFDFT